MVGFYSTRRFQYLNCNFQIKVVDSLSPCFRGDFPESVTADRYVTSEWEDPWKHLKNGKPWAPHHPWTCESSPQSPQTETYSTVNTARARCVKTLLLSVLDLRTWYKWYILSLMKYTTWYSQRLVLLSDRTKRLRERLQRCTKSYYSNSPKWLYRLQILRYGVVLSQIRAHHRILRQKLCLRCSGHIL